jgi:hypothetical protein
VALVQVTNAGLHVYDVADPLHPRLLCRMTLARHPHLLSNRTVEYLAADGSGAWTIERLTFGSAPVAVAAAQSGPYSVAWGPNGALVYERQIMDATGQCCGTAEIHVLSGGADRVLCKYQVPLIGIGGGRFPPTRLFDISNDGYYFANSALFGKGSKGCALFVNIADGSAVATIPDDAEGGFWSSRSQRLYLLTRSGVQAWTSAAGFRTLTTDTWIQPSEAPGGQHVAYTYYKKASGDDVNLRVGVYELGTGPTSGLPDKPRSQAGFVTTSVLWYLEEGPCADPSTCTGSALPTGNVLACNLDTGVESAVTFAEGAPLTSQDYASFAIWPAPAG